MRLIDYASKIIVLEPIWYNSFYLIRKGAVGTISDTRFSVNFERKDIAFATPLHTVLEGPICDFPLLPFKIRPDFISKYRVEI